jgi:hypothetical protein
MRYSKVYCANSNLLLLYIHVKKWPPIFLQIQRWGSFSPKTHLQIVQKRLPHSPIELRTAKTKSLCIWPTMVRLILSQRNNQPTIPRPWSLLSNTMIANSPYTFITVDCRLVASFSNLVKVPHHGHVDHGNCNFETEVWGIKLIPVE